MFRKNNISEGEKDKLKKLQKDLSSIQKDIDDLLDSKGENACSFFSKDNIKRLQSLSLFTVTTEDILREQDKSEIATVISQLSGVKNFTVKTGRTCHLNVGGSKAFEAPSFECASSEDAEALLKVLQDLFESNRYSKLPHSDVKEVKARPGTMGSPCYLTEFIQIVGKKYELLKEEVNTSELEVSHAIKSLRM